MILAALLAFQLVDSIPLKHVADSIGVPSEVLFAVAYMESRNGNRGNEYIGPGREQCDSGGCRRVCREVGRMQINPCIRWQNAVCSRNSIRTYNGNITCGAVILKGLFGESHSWLLAVERYNGSGFLARRYIQEALVFIGKRGLARLE